ncbi:MAG: hypothetical protein JWM56_838 [Candidatus Peribacteria bacterium]|nr:hypothetical protein [Candidatus Peribacteria bacterium]
MTACHSVRMFVHFTSEAFMMIHFIKDQWLGSGIIAISLAVVIFWMVWRLLLYLYDSLVRPKRERRLLQQAVQRVMEKKGGHPDDIEAAITITTQLTGLSIEEVTEDWLDQTS